MIDFTGISAPSESICVILFFAGGLFAEFSRKFFGLLFWYFLFLLFLLIDKYVYI